MRAALLFTLLSLVLTACFNRPDSLAPLVTITDPPTGTVRRAAGLEVWGYALDDDGITSIRVNNSENFFASPSYARERGNRLVRFGFGAAEIQAGQRRFTVEVEDGSGRVTTLLYEIQIDTEAPVISAELEAVASDQVRVSGLVSDNDRVTRILIGDGENDNELSFSPVEQRRFSLVIPRSETVRLVAFDQAGNEACVVSQALSAFAACSE